MNAPAELPVPSPELRLSILGMRCAGCVSSVESALAEVKGVKSVSVNFADHSAVVKGQADPELLKQAVKAAGYDAAVMEGFEESLKLLQTDYVDLYLIHWPVKGKYNATWKVMEEIYRSGRARAIGVSNFLQHHLEDLFTIAETRPMVDQVECHPYVVQQSLIDFCQSNNIV